MHEVLSVVVLLSACQQVDRLMSGTAQVPSVHLVQMGEVGSEETVLRIAA